MSNSHPSPRRRIALRGLIGCLSILALGVVAIASLLILVPYLVHGPAAPEVKPLVLLLDLPSFPANWQANEGKRNRRVMDLYGRAWDQASRRYWVKTSEGKERSKGYHDVASYGSESIAHKDYQALVKSAPYGDCWEGMAGWDYQPQADEYDLRFFQVTQESHWLRAFYLARYGRYVTMLNFWVVAEDMQPEEMQRIIQTLDKTFAQLKED